MNIVYMGGKQAGCIGLTTVLALGHNVLGVIGYDELVCGVGHLLELPVHDSIKDITMDPHMVDLIVSVHGREIINDDILSTTYYGGMNVHPCLYKYKGPDPITRLLADGETQASVGVHWMTQDIDMGETIFEVFVDVEGQTTVEQVYNTLYPYYILALRGSLMIL